jgi:uncharacterized protein YgiM (DUF1202 family)
MARGALLALLWVSAADAAAARLKTDATLHARPSTTSESVGEVPAGTRVDVLSESGGWHEVRTPSGQGFIRSEYLVLGELAEPATKPAEKKADKPPPAPAPAPTPAPTPRVEPPRESDRVSTEELRRLTDEVRLLRERPEPVTIADLDRVEQSLTQAIATLREKPAAAAEPPLPDTSLESVLAVSPVLLLVGGVVGWIASRVTQRRRDHRSRIRV